MRGKFETLSVVSDIHLRFLNAREQKKNKIRRSSQLSLRESCKIAEISCI